MKCSFFYITVQAEIIMLAKNVKPIETLVPRRCFFCGSFLLVVLHVGVCCSL